MLRGTPAIINGLCKNCARPSCSASCRAFFSLHFSAREVKARRRAARSAGGPRERDCSPGPRIIRKLSTVVALESSLRKWRRFRRSQPPRDGEV